MNLQDHALQHARELNVKVSLTAAPYNGSYRPLFRQIYAAPIRDLGWHASPDGGYVHNFTEELNYFVLLHELGHCANGHDRSPKTPADEIDMEGQAWDWALDNCLTPPSPDTCAHIRDALKHYADVAHIPVENAPEMFQRAWNRLSERTDT